MPVFGDILLKCPFPRKKKISMLQNSNKISKTMIRSVSSPFHTPTSSVKRTAGDEVETILLKCSKINSVSVMMCFQAIPKRPCPFLADATVRSALTSLFIYLFIYFFRMLILSFKSL